jgi:CarD family transcriptional regulator
MIRTLYQHKQEQITLGRKFHLSDENFLRDAQRLLDSELSVILGIDVKEVGPYIKAKLLDM